MVMENRAHALAREELIRVLTVYQGITTANGAVAGNTLEDSNLIGVNDFITDKTILIFFGNAINETKAATVFNPATGVITVAPAFNAQIIIGTPFRILNIPAGSSLTIIIATITAIFGLVNAILTLNETGGIVTATGLATEDNVYINDAPAGVFKPIVVTIDMSDLAGGEVATVRTRYRIAAPPAALELKGAPVIFNGVQAEPLKDIELTPNRFGVQVTIEATAAVAFPWEAHLKD